MESRKSRGSTITTTVVTTSRSRSSSRGRSMAEQTSLSSKTASSASKKATTRPKRSNSRGRSSRSPARKKASPSPEKKSQSKKKASPSPARKKTSPSPARKKATPKPAKKKVSSKPSDDASDSDSSVDKEVVIKKTVVKESATPVIKGSRSSTRLMERHDHIACTLGNDTSKAAARLSDAKPVHSNKATRLYGGPIGASLLILLLPALVYALNFLCEKPWTLRLVTPPKDWRQYFNIKAALVWVVFVKLQGLLALIPIGKLARDSHRMQHRCNGFLALFVTLAALGCLAYYKKVPLEFVTDNYLAVLTTATVSSFFVGIFLYVKARWAPRSSLNHEANTGCFPYDFFLGQETNPRWLHMDFKFVYIRLCMISWLVIDLLFCLKYYEANKDMNPALALVTFFHFIYVTDFIIFERSILTTYGMLHESFGFLMAFVCLSFTPFTYSLTVRYLSQNPIIWSPWALAGFALVNLVGFVIYRASNWQKDQFRRDPHHPSLSKLATIPTSSKRLLAGGWWAFVRHPNYLGDIIMSFAWSMPAGCGFALPWFYPVFLSMLIIGRICTVERSCEKKYGSAWRTYKERVPYRLIPYIF